MTNALMTYFNLEGRSNKNNEDKIGLRKLSCIQSLQVFKNTNKSTHLTCLKIRQATYVNRVSCKMAKKLHPTLIWLNFCISVLIWNHCIEMRCELHFDKTVHFVWNVIDVSIIIIVHAHSLCENAYNIVH